MTNLIREPRRWMTVLVALPTLIGKLCADPESFVRGRPTFTTLKFFIFLVDMGGGEIPNPT